MNETQIVDLLYKNKKLLDEREFFILEQRLGLSDGFYKTQQQIANKLKISKQRVSVIEKRAIIKLTKTNLKKSIDKISKDILI